MLRALGITLFLLGTVAFAENEPFALTVVTRDGRVNARTRGLLARLLPAVEIRSSTAFARYRQSPQLIEATCPEAAYYLHDAAGALIGRGCLSETEIASAIYAIRSQMKRNQAYYAANDRNPVVLLDQALAAAAVANRSYAAAILDRPEMRDLPPAEQDIARRLRLLLLR